VSPAATTTYTCSYSYIGCPVTATGTVTVIPSFTANIIATNDTVCYGVSTSLTASPTGVGYSYSWTASSTLSSTTIFNPVASPLNTTTYVVTITDGNGCTSSTSVIVYVDAPLNATISATNVTCNAACNGQATVSASGGSSVYSYLWNSGCTTSVCSGLCASSYNVTVIDSWGCTATASVNITEPAALNISFSNIISAACNGYCDGSVTALASGGTVSLGYNYSWNTIPVQTKTTANSLCAGNYICTITDANSCTFSKIVYVPQVPGPIATVSSNVTIDAGSSITLIAGGGTSYNWLNATGMSCNNCYNPSVSPLETITYCVEVINDDLCKDTACVVVYVEEPCHLNENSILPNAFSPNDDNMNDLFCMQGWKECTESFKIIILTRFGEKVFESTDPDFCWDGKYLNNTLESQVLVYFIKARFIKSKKRIEKRGNISLLR